MKVESDRLAVATDGRIAVKDITADVEAVLRKRRIASGVCHVSVPHTTCAVVINEAESGLLRDIERLAGELLEPMTKRGPFRHDRVDHNAKAHLTSVALGAHVTVPVRDGRLGLGTWQSVFLVDCDGPRSRSVDVTLIGT